MTSRVIGAIFLRLKDASPFFGDLKVLEDITMRTRITLACTDCKNRNYDTTKDKKTHPDRMEIKKYCKFCRKHTIHKETK